MFGLPVMIWVIFAATVCVTAYIAGERMFTRRTARMLESALKGEDFFHSLLVGVSYRDAWDVEGREVYSDAKYTLVIKRGEEPVAVLGFTLTKDAVRVYQMQGLRGVNLKGIRLGPWLLPYAELIARRLRKHVLWVQAAERHWYFDRPSLEEKGLYEEHRQHKLRMAAVYNEAPRGLGFVVDESQNFLHGHYKIVRKKITFVRAMHILAYLMHRSLRPHQAFLQAETNH